MTNLFLGLWKTEDSTNSLAVPLKVKHRVSIPEWHSQACIQGKDNRRLKETVYTSVHSDIIHGIARKW